jgi:hypothetical protein
MKRRRVDLSLRVQEAKDVEQALTDWLAWYAEAGGEGQGAMRVGRVLVRLRRGITYVIEVNPSHRPKGANTRS